MLMIELREIDEYMTKEIKELHLEFDIDDINSYRHLIDAYRDNHIFDELGDMNILDWDYMFLRTVIKTIIESQRERLLTEVLDYSDFWMTSDFIFNSITYALVNNRREVGQKEILSTFKNWDYLPFEIMLDGLNEVYEREHLDYSTHPFNVSKSRCKKPYQKIIPFKLNNDSMKN